VAHVWETPVFQGSVAHETAFPQLADSFPNLPFGAGKSLTILRENS
jgi:hypothetical protein